MVEPRVYPEDEPLNYQKSNSHPETTEEAPDFSLRFEIAIPTKKRYLDGNLLGMLRSLEAAAQASARIGGHESPGELDLARIRVALAEALANAAEHGNGYRSEALICIRAEATRQGLRIELEDEGAGFDPERESQLARDQGTRRERGRGLAFLRGLTDELRFEKGGARVVLVFGRRKAEP